MFLLIIKHLTLCQWGSRAILSADALLVDDSLPCLGEMSEFGLLPDYSLDGSSEDFSSLALDSFINLSPPQAHDYHFGMEVGEGISELFDCDFGELAPLDF